MVCIDSYWWMVGEGEGGRQGAGCVCVLEGGDQADNYRSNRTHTHTSLVAQSVKTPPAVWETWVQSPGEGNGYHSSILFFFFLNFT